MPCQEKGIQQAFRFIIPEGEEMYLGYKYIYKYYIYNIWDFFFIDLSHLN